MKKNVFLTIVLASLVLGCTAAGAGEETKLSGTQGLGILSFGTQSSTSIYPGSQLFLSLLLRNNALGSTSENVTVSLENVRPFTLIDCTGSLVDPEQDRLDNDSCSNPILFSDNGLLNSQHKLNYVFPDEELEVLWLLRAPTGGETAHNSYDHKIYVYLNYNYTMRSSVNVIGLSQDEVMKRRTEGVQVTGVRGDTITSAGDLGVDTSQTVQPMMFPTTKGRSPEYYLSFSIKNTVGAGGGLPRGVVNVTVHTPPGILIADKAESIDYDWDILECETPTGDGGEECVVNKKIESTSVIIGNNLVMPYEISTDELELLVDNSIGEKTYTFYIEMDYEYYISSDATLKVEII